MRWIRKDYKGDEQIWYSEGDIIKCMFIIREIKRILLSNKMPSLPLAGVNAILDLIKKIEDYIQNE